MIDEASFLLAIAANPTDIATRLAYADWLEEHGAPHAELVRVEEEMRRLPVFSDEFWQLKPQRNKLRAGATTDWLATMGYGTDCQPVFQHGFPDSWRGRWRLIREFTERWHRISLPDVGGRAEEIRQTEATVGQALSPSVREWVAFACDIRTSPDDHDVLRDVYQMTDLKGHESISLLLQAEGDYHWAVRYADLAMPDPPVYGFRWDHEDHDENIFAPDGVSPVATSLTSFVLGYVIGYTYGEGGGFGAEVSEPAQLVRKLRATFPVHCELGETEVFERENIQVRLHHWASREYVTVEVFRPMPQEAVPAFLWDYTRQGGAFHGMFAPGTEQGAVAFRGG